MLPLILIGLYLLLQGGGDSHAPGGGSGEHPNGVFYPVIRATDFRPDAALLAKLTLAYGPGQLFGTGFIDQFYWINYPGVLQGEAVYQMSTNYLWDLGGNRNPPKVAAKGNLSPGFWEACPAGFPGGKQWCHRNEQGYFV